MDAYTGDLFSVEQKDIDCLESEINFQYGDQIKPANCLHNIWAVLSSLSEIKLKQGSYLLRHGFHDGICVQIWNSTDEQGESLLNLHETYTAVDTTLTVQKDVSDNWLALDPWTMFPAQRALGRPPLTFEPGKESNSINSCVITILMSIIPAFFKYFFRLQRAQQNEEVGWEEEKNR